MLWLHKRRFLLKKHTLKYLVEKAHHMCDVVSNTLGKIKATCEQACVTNKRVRAGCGGKCQVINPLVCLDTLGSALTALHPRKPLSPLQNWTLGYPTHQPEQYHGKLRYSWLHYDLLFFPTTSKCSDCSSTNTKLLSYKTGKHWVRLNVGNGEICGQL